MQRKVVYLIEDDMITINVLKFYIKKHGYEVVGDFNADSLNLSVPPPSIYIVDINLKGKNGIEVCKAIKGKQQDVPVVLMSANPTLRDFISVCNAEDFIPKPLDIEQVIATIDKYVA